MNRQWFLAAVTVGISFLGVVLFLEIGIRIISGDPFSRKSQLKGHGNRIERPQAVYHSRLGWLPKPGRNQVLPTSINHIDKRHIRSNGRPTEAADAFEGPPILAVGDSFTFGDEVHDHETWPAQLEKLAQRRVINAGVFAYGVDQAVLRGEMIAKESNPSMVIVALIGDDINRTEFSYYWAWKPYFEHRHGRLVLHNVPVPRGRPYQSRFETYRELLGYSFLAATIVRRVGPASWRFSGIIKKHNAGEAVTLALLGRLQRFLARRGARLLVVALSVNERIGNDERLKKLVASAKDAGLNVLDLIPEIVRLKREVRDSLYRPWGHYTPEMNRWVAHRIASHIGMTSARN